jgi:signal transduction histidine kinase
MTFQTKLAGAYGLAVVLLCAMGVVSYRNAQHVEETRQWGRHSNVVIHRMEAFHSGMQRMEEISFENWGTGDAGALASMSVLRKDTERALADVKELTADNPSQQERLALLAPKLGRFCDLLAADIQLTTGSRTNSKANSKPGSRSTPRASSERVQLSENISSLFQQMNSEEDRLSLVRRQAIDEGLRRSSYFLIFGYANAILLSVLCIVLLRNEMRKRSEIRRELEQSQAELESRVRERTEDLHAANQALRDQIEERKKAEQLVQQLNASLETRVEQRTLELRQAVKELDAFCYSVSHDLRAPLRHVDGFSRILENEFCEQLSGDARHYLTRIIQAVGQMGRLIDDLLDLSRIGRKKLSLKKVSLQDAVERLIANARFSDDGRAVEWRIDPLPDWNCDPGLLDVVLSNLIENAMKFSRNARPPVIQFGTLNAGSQNTVFVRDNGVGFDPKYADKLFGVFQRLHRQEDFEGTGIGLATVQRIVQRHGGAIRAESQPGCGATFYFTLGPQASADLAPKLDEVKHVRV